MVTLNEIEAAIQQLPDIEVWELTAHLQAYINDKWDQQLESDLGSGKLDALISKAERDITAKQVRTLDEVLYDA
ncbi:MAG: hypothetical protein WA902_02835 [Thermosynechococcaceae cyanobacterium]